MTDTSESESESYQSDLPDKFTLLCWNVFKWNPRKREINDIITTYRPDIICLQEIKIAKHSTTPKKLEVPPGGFCPIGYKGKTLPRNKNGGGVCILVKESWRMEEVLVLKEDSAEVITLRLNGVLYVSNVYFPPQQEFDKNLEENLSKIFECSSSNHMVVGDFNAHGPLWHSLSNLNTRGRAVERLVNENSDYVFLNERTYTLSGKNLSSPDITLATSDLAYKCSWQTLEKRGSDHLPIFVKVSFRLSAEENNSNFLATDWTVFKKTVSDACNDKLIFKKTSKAEHMEEMLRKTMIDSRRISNVQFDVDLRKVRWLEKLMTMEIIGNYDEEKLWKMLKEDQSGQGSAPLIDLEDGNFRMTGILAANGISQILCNRAARRHDDDRNENWRTNLKIRNDSPFNQIVTAAEIKKVIQEQESATDLGPERIACVHLKHLPDNAVEIMSRVFTNFLSKGSTPTDYKRGEVMMLLQPSQNPYKISSYNLVTRVSPLAMALEQIIANRIEEEIGKPKCKYECRFDFCSSTLRMSAMNFLKTGFKKGFSLVTCIKFNNAMQTIRHSKLLRELSCKLRKNHIHIARWICNYLDQRKIQVLYDNCKSEEVTLEGGLFLGNALTSLLFAFYFQEIPQPEDESIQLFLNYDGVVVVCQGEEKETIETETESLLENLETFFHEIDISVSVEKSTTMYVGKGRITKPSVKWGETEIQNVKSTNLFGCIVTPKLSMTKHIESIIRLTASRMNILKTLAGTTWCRFDKKTLVDTFSVIIQPLFNKESLVFYVHPHIIASKWKELKECYTNSLRFCISEIPEDTIYKKKGGFETFLEVAKLQMQIE